METKDKLVLLGVNWLVLLFLNLHVAQKDKPPCRESFWKIVAHELKRYES